MPVVVLVEEADLRGTQNWLVERVKRVAKYHAAVKPGIKEGGLRRSEIPSTSESAKKGVKTKLIKYGPTHYEEIGRAGGKAQRSRYFDNPRHSRAAARKRWQPDDKEN